MEWRRRDPASELELKSRGFRVCFTAVASQKAAARPTRRWELLFSFALLQSRARDISFVYF